MKDELHDADDGDDASEPDAFEVEGIQAFNRLAGAVQGLESRLVDLELGLGRKAAQALEAASTAHTAAQNATQAAERAQDATRADARSWTAYAALVVAGSVLSAGIVGYVLGERAGQATGEAAGYRTAVDHNAAASWANTPAGQLALALDRAGSLSTLAQCSNQGWKVETIQGRRLCIVRPVKDGSIYGWTLP